MRSDRKSFIRSHNSRLLNFRAHETMLHGSISAAASEFRRNPTILRERTPLCERITGRSVTKASKLDRMIYFPRRIFRRVSSSTRCRLANRGRSRKDMSSVLSDASKRGSGISLGGIYTIIWEIKWDS